MIAKNIKGKSFKGCVSYVMHEGATLLEAEGVWAETKQDVIRSFAQQRSGRREVKQPVGHIPLSFAPEDKGRMTNDFMVQLAKEYMEEMGIRNTQYIIVRHHNADNEHLHIVYNRINNDLKLISVNHDYKRNVKVCKKLKDKYGLTYGKGKERVKREKLRSPDKIKYLIYDTINTVLPYCKNEKELQSLLQKSGVETEFKLKRATGEVEGISFSCENISFKGSQVDRKFSYGNLKKEFEKNIHEQMAGEDQRQKHAKEIPQPMQNKPKQAEQKMASSIEKRGSPKIGGVEITGEQSDVLKEGGFIFLENMTNSKGQQFSAYVITDEKQQRAFFFKNRPDEFVKYGIYEMRAMDKRLIEAGYIIKAKVKYWGGGFAHPYLWKPDAVKDEAAERLAGYELLDGSDYCQSWGDPRLAKTQKEEQKPRQAVVMKRNRGRGM